jgi:hypothetical protein
LTFAVMRTGAIQNSGCGLDAMKTCAEATAGQRPRAHAIQTAAATVRVRR